MTDKQTHRADGGMSRVGKITEMDRSFDMVYWQGQPAAVRFAAVWEMAVFHHKLRKGDPDELRLDRSVEKLGRRGR